MSWKFDKSEVPQFTADRRTRGEGGAEDCVACRTSDWTDMDTGLCRACWRIVILGPSMENRE